MSAYPQNKNKRSNEHTKAQIREFLEKSIEESQKPNLREEAKRKRRSRRKSMAKYYGIS